MSKYTNEQIGQYWREMELEHHVPIHDMERFGTLIGCVMSELLYDMDNGDEILQLFRDGTKNKVIELMKAEGIESDGKISTEFEDDARSRGADLKADLAAQARIGGYGE